MSNLRTMTFLLFVLISLCFICDASESKQQQFFHRKSVRTQSIKTQKEWTSNDQNNFEKKTRVENPSKIEKRHLQLIKKHRKTLYSDGHNKSLVLNEKEYQLTRKFNQNRRELQVFQFFCRMRLRRCERDIQDAIDSCPGPGTLALNNDIDDDVSANQIFGFFQGSCTADLESCQELSESIDCANTISPTSNPTSAKSLAPTSEPTSNPTSAKTSAPTSEPTSNPTSAPTLAPTSEPTTLSPTMVPVYKVPPVGTQVKAKIVINNDNFPDELIWGIEDITNGVRGLYNGFGEPNITTVDILMKVGDNYEVIVTDNYGDGFCCPGGSFEISIDLIGNGVYLPIYQLTDNYGNSRKHRFAVVDACNNLNVAGHTNSTCTSSSDCCTNLCADGKCIVSCPKGYELSLDGTKCEDIDECTLGTDNCGSSNCINTVGSFLCLYQLPADGTKLTASVVIENDFFFDDLSWSIDDSTDGVELIAGVGKPNTTTTEIILTVGKKYEAVLNDLYLDGFCCPGGSFKIVVDIGDNLNMVLVNVEGNYTSPSINPFTLGDICNNDTLFGFTGSPCDVGSSCCTGICLDGFCSKGCPEGFALNSEGTSCEDADECALGTDNCGDFECVNTDGGFQCFYRIPPVGSELSGKIRIVPDEFPDELSWTLNDVTANRNALYSGTGDVTDNPITLKVGDDYEAILSDQFGDGFCCPVGSFNIEVNLGNGVFLPVASVVGDYGFSKTLAFSVVDVCNADSLLGSTGSSCIAANDCCSGFCIDGTCANGCPSGFEFTSGGTCANIDECALDADECGSLPCTDTEGAYECTFQLASYTTVDGTIVIQSDNYPEEFSWVINDVTNDLVVATGSGRSGTQTIAISIETGVEYKAVLQDSFGDGFGFTGSFIVSVQIGGSRAFKLVEVTGDYGRVKEVPFSISDLCDSEIIFGNNGSTCSSGTDCCSGKCLDGKCLTRCDEGFEFNGDQSSCIDVDECAAGGVGLTACGSSVCKNLVGSYICVYQLPPDGTAIPGFVLIQPDNYPEDFSFAIQNLNSGETTLSGTASNIVGADFFEKLDTITIAQTQLTVGTSYEAILTDTVGDGFGAPNGAFVIYVELGSKLVNLTEISGNYGASAILPFSLANICDSEAIEGSNNSTCSDASDCCSNLCSGGKCVVGCSPGYELNGSDCEDINECTLMTDNCGVNACINTDGGFQCVYQLPANGIELNGRVDIVYDFFPAEFSWEISDMSSTTLYNGAGQDGSTTEKVDISLIVGDSYKAVLTDSASDGFCCNGGSFTISVEIETGVFLEIAKVSDTGPDDNFGPLKEIEFSVASICSDSANAGSNESPCSSPNECCSGVCTDGVCKAD